MPRSWTGGGYLTATPSRAGCAGSESASSNSGPDACADWHGGCGGGPGGAPEAGVAARPANLMIGAPGPPGELGSRYVNWSSSAVDRRLAGRADGGTGDGLRHRRT
jgi:hypothetical protein